MTEISTLDFRQEACKEFEDLYATLEDFEKEQNKEFTRLTEIVKKCVDTGKLDPQIESLILDNGENTDNRKRNRTATAKVKKEKVSAILQEHNVLQSSEVPSVKVEKEDMPAPNWIPPQKIKKEKKTIAEPVTTGRVTRTRTKKTLERASVVVMEEPAPVISLTDDEDTAEKSISSKSLTKQPKTGQSQVEEIQEEPSRSTRTRTRAQKKPSAIDTEDIPEVRSTRTRTIKKAARVETTEVQEAALQVTEVAEACTADTNIAHEAAISSEVPKTREKIKRGLNGASDDESTAGHVKKKSKSMSPPVDDGDSTHDFQDALSSLEPRNCDANETYVMNSAISIKSVPSVPPISKTNLAIAGTSVTKPTNLKMNGESVANVSKPQGSPVIKDLKKICPDVRKKVEAYEQLGKSDEPFKTAKNTPQSASKMVTPMKMGFVPMSSSTSRLHKIVGKSSSFNFKGDASIYTKDQAIKKKEAILKEQSESKRKLNEEKQLKAQQYRILQEKAKEKQLLAQKEKEDRMKQREREREEYIQKHKLDAERKRKEAEEQRKKIRELQKHEAKPLYMTTKAPLLPTDDCYDSDEEDPNRTKRRPTWCNETNLKTAQLAMLSAGEKIKNTLFSRQAQTINLVEIFENPSLARIKRTSSRIWRTPPRYTMIPDCGNAVFTDDEFLDD